MAVRIQSIKRSLTLLPTIAQSVTFDLDPDAQGGQLGFGLTLNNGANLINAILWERSELGDEYFTDLGYATAAGVSLAANTDVSLDDNGIRSRYLRVTLTSTLGTTCELRLRGGPS